MTTYSLPGSLLLNPVLNLNGKVFPVPGTQDPLFVRDALRMALTVAKAGPDEDKRRLFQIARRILHHPTEHSLIFSEEELNILGMKCHQFWNVEAFGYLDELLQSAQPVPSQTEAAVQETEPGVATE